jgi:hypothetical protein
MVLKGVIMYLNGLLSCVIRDNDDYVVKYGIKERRGECRYRLMEMRGKNKPIIQKVFVMVGSDMTEIIDYLNGQFNFDEGDYDRLSMEIREDSLRVLEDYYSKI